MNLTVSCSRHRFECRSSCSSCFGTSPTHRTSCSSCSPVVFRIHSVPILSVSSLVVSRRLRRTAAPQHRSSYLVIEHRQPADKPQTLSYRQRSSASLLPKTTVVVPSPPTIVGDTLSLRRSLSTLKIIQRAPIFVSAHSYYNARKIFSQVPTRKVGYSAYCDVPFSLVMVY